MDDTASLLALADRMLWVTALVAAPVLIASLVVGLVIGIVQAATSINEQTLTFVPKLAVIALVVFNAVALNQFDKLLRRITCQCGFNKVRVATDKVGGLDFQVSKVTTATTADQDFTPSLLGIIEYQYITTSVTRCCSTH